MDFFKETTIEKDDTLFRMYEKKTEAKFFTEKRIKTDLEVKHARIRLVLNLKSLQGTLYLKTVLEKIEISRKLFVIAVQDGDEIFIPSDLSQSKLPISFRYYDPIIQVVQERMAPGKSDYFKLKNSLKQEIYGEVDVNYKMLEQLGLRDTHNKKF